MSREGLESLAMPQTPQPASTRVQRIQHLAGDGVCLGQRVSSRRQLTAPAGVALAVWCAAAKEHANEALLLR
jgi:hypothetical protein